MDILFATSKLQKTLGDDRLRQKAHGELARVIGQRLDDLAALENLAEAFALPGKFHPLREDRDGQFAMSVGKNHRLLLEPATAPLPRKADGGIDLARVTAIRVLGVEDYH